MTANPAVTEQDMANLRHALGATKHVSKKVWGFRRHFATGLDGPDHESMLRLEAAGFMMRGRHDPEAKLIFFFATQAGCEAAGLDATQTARALEDVWNKKERVP